MKKPKTARYFIRVNECVEPFLHGPFPTEGKRLEAARDEFRDEDVIFRLNIIGGIPEVECFSGAEMEEEQ